MISETEKLAIEVEDMPFKGWSTDIGTRVAAELRRLAVIEQEFEALKKTLSEAEPAAWIVEGWSDTKRIAAALHHSIDDVKTYAAEFSQHYPTIHTLPLYTLKGIKK